MGGQSGCIAVLKWVFVAVETDGVAKTKLGCLVVFSVSASMVGALHLCVVLFDKSIL